MNITQIWAKYKAWIIFGIIAIVLFPSILRALTKGDEKDAPVKVGGGTPVFKCNVGGANKDTVISQGTKRSNEVCYLQSWLNQYFSAGLKVDGDFGVATRNAVNSYVKNAGLTFSLRGIGAL